MKTRAAILVQHNSPLILDELEIPLLKPKQVLVEIAYSGVCGTQIGEWRGTRGEDKYLPHCLGHEGSGRVIDAGSDVTRTRVGDDVVLSWIRPEGSSGGCTYHRPNRNYGMVNAGAITTFQHHAVLDENCVTKIPAGCSMEEAALLGCAAATGMGAIFNVLNVSRAHSMANHSIAIFGVGGVGLCAVMAAAYIGAYPIIAVDPNTKRAGTAAKFGATYVGERAPSSVVDFAVEASGKVEAMKQAVASVRPRGGKVVVIGNADRDKLLMIDPHTFNQGKSILGTWGGDTVPSRDFRQYADVLKSFKTEELPTYYPLEKINDAMEDLAAGKVWRPFISMSM